MSGPARPRIVVAGGGISGLAAAYRIVASARALGREVEVTLLDASDSLGGSIATVREGGFVMEAGPDCFISTKPAAVELCCELGLERRLIGTNPAHRRSFIARAGRLHQVPEGFHLLAPSKLWPFVTTELFSWPGKLRMGLDLLLPRGGTGEDESLESFVVRRLGREALERAAQPMIGGIYTADPATLSLKATMPQFLEMEREHRSLLLGMWRARRAREKGQNPTGEASGARYDLFLTLDTGLATLVDTLTSRLPEGAVRLRSRLRALEALPAGRWRLACDGADSIEADAVLLALPAPASAALLEAVDPALAGELREIHYASIATVNFQFARGQVGHSLDGMGFVVPAVEGRSIVACSFSSVKFAARAPGDKVLLRAFVGGAMHPHALERSDEDLADAAVEDLRVYLDLRGRPERTLVSRYPNAMPQYRLGHLDCVARIEGREATLQGLALAGNAYRGVGLGDCIASAERAVKRVMEGLLRK